MEINLINQTVIVIMFAITLGLLIMTVGFVGLQHQKLFDDIKHDTAEKNNQTTVIIMNVTGVATNLTKAILKNITLQIELNDELVNSKVDRAMGVAVRTHNDVQQVLHWILNLTNSTGRPINILPDFK